LENAFSKSPLPLQKALPHHKMLLRKKLGNKKEDATKPKSPLDAKL
jgi:hypothetical protein